MISIIGAGPAGSYTAYLLSKKGHEVTVYEEGDEIGNPIQCSGVVTPAIDNLIKIKNDIIINRIKRVRFISPNNSSFEVNIKPDYVYDRGELDKYLANLAEKAGTKFKLNHRFKTYDHFNKDELKLKFEKGKTENTNILIGADGPFSRVAQAANLFDKRKYITGLQARCKIRNDDKSRVDIYLGYGEFGWSIPEDEYTSRIGIVSETNKKDDFNRLIKKLNAEIINYQSGMIPLYNPKAKTQTDKVYLIGDAATQCKAATHGGILFSLLAAEELAKAIHEKKDYEKLWKKKLGLDLWLNLRIRNTLCKFSHEDYNKLVYYFSQDKLKNLLTENVRDFPSKFVFKMLSKEPRLMKFITKAI